MLDYIRDMVLVPAFYDFLEAAALVVAVGFIVLVLAVWAGRVGTDLLGRFW